MLQAKLDNICNMLLVKDFKQRKAKIGLGWYIGEIYQRKGEKTILESCCNFPYEELWGT